MQAGSTSRRIGELLTERGLLREADLEAALSYQAAHGGRVGAVLLRMGALTGESFYPVLAEQLGLGLVRASQLDEALLRAGQLALGAAAARLLTAGLLAWQDETGGWQLAATDPLQAELREAVAEHELLSGASWALLPEADFEGLRQRLDQGETSLQALDARALRELAEDAPVIALVNNLVAQAVEARASDIHLEPGEREFEVRLRIDGVLHRRSTLPMDRYPAVASRIKLIAGMDIAERRLPQDGRISTRAAGAGDRCAGVLDSGRLWRIDRDATAAQAPGRPFAGAAGHAADAADAVQALAGHSQRPGAGHRPPPARARAPRFIRRSLRPTT